MIPMVRVDYAEDISETKILVVCERGHVQERPRKRRAAWTGRVNSEGFSVIASEEDPWPKRVRCAECAQAEEGGGDE